MQRDTEFPSTGSFHKCSQQLGQSRELKLNPSLLCGGKSNKHLGYTPPRPSISRMLELGMSPRVCISRMLELGISPHIWALYEVLHQDSTAALNTCQHIQLIFKEVAVFQRKWMKITYTTQFKYFLTGLNKL